MEKVKFTTNINKSLLEEIKIKAIKEGKNVNRIIEEQLKKYLEEKDMTRAEKLYFEAQAYSGEGRHARYCEYISIAPEELEGAGYDVEAILDAEEYENVVVYENAGNIIFERETSVSEQEEVEQGVDFEEEFTREIKDAFIKILEKE